MSVHKNPFDEHFHRRLNDLESPIPTDLFDRLQARRGGALPADTPMRERLAAHESPVSETIFDAVLVERERRKRRRIVLWRAVAGIAALWFLVTMILERTAKNEGLKTPANAPNSELNKVPNPTLNEAKIVENNKNTEGSKNELNSKNEELNGVNTELNSKNEALKTPINSANVELDKGYNSVSNSVKKQQIPINKTANSNKEVLAINAEKRAKYKSNNINAIINRRNTEGSKNELNSKNSELNITPNSVNDNVNNTINAELNNAKTMANSSNNSELNTAKTVINSENTEGSKNELNSKNSTIETAFNNRLSPPNFQTPTLDFLHILGAKPVPILEKKRENPCSDPEYGCPNFGGRRRGMGAPTFYVDAFGAPEYMKRRFKTNLLESEKLLAARDSVEKTQYAVSAGIRASVVLTNGLALRTGVVFTQMNERAQFDSLGIGNIKTTYDVQIVNGRPDTVSITTVITDGIFRKTRYNHYRSIDIPLQIGYEIPFRNGWTFGINGGANLNVMAWRKADIVGSDLRKQTVSSSINEGNPVFKNKLGISLVGSVAAYRQLTSGLQLVIEPSVRYGLQPITRTDYALKQQYATAGLIVGLRLRL